MRSTVDPRRAAREFETAVSVKFSRFAQLALLVTLLGIQLCLFLAGAITADPGTDVAVPDLEVLRRWQVGTDLSEVTAGRGHLIKPGYILFLRVALPNGGEPGEVRRLLVFQALWIWTGIAALSVALWRRGQRFAGVFLAALCLLSIQLRDVADWIITEPLAIGATALFGAALVILPKRPSLGLAALGASCPLILLVRPNLGFALFAIAVVLFATADVSRWGSVAALLLGFLGTFVLLVLLARLARWPLDPGSIPASQALFFGSREYAWPPAPEEWPSGETPEDRNRADLEAVRGRWADFLRRFGADELRSIAWRTTHAFLSAEEFPTRWEEPHYFRASKFLRRWWWIPAILVASAAIACATTRSEWRFVPAAILAISAGQGLLFGAETRYTLPLLPLLHAAIGITIPLLRGSRRAWVVAACGAALLALVAYRVPETVASDYAVLHPGDAVRERVGRSRFSRLESAVLHLRMLAEPRDVGLEIDADGTPLFRRRSGETSPYPAVWTLPVPPALLEGARRDGIELEVRCLGDPSGKGFLYFPVVPELLGPKAALNGSDSLPSGFGGRTSGGFPVWTHALTRAETHLN